MFKKVFCLILLLFITAGCAATGVGEFPRLDAEHEGENILIAPVQGINSAELQQQLFGRLDIGRLRKRYGTVYFLQPAELQQLAIEEYFHPMSSSQLTGIAEQFEADFLLGMHVDQFSEEEFVKEGTRTLYHHRDRRRETFFEGTRSDTPVGDGVDYISPDHRLERETTEGRAITRERIFDAEEVPVTTPRIRAVISLSAYLYDLRTGELIWVGNRIEKATGDLDRVSGVELAETVLSRVAERLSVALTPGI